MSTKEMATIAFRVDKTTKAEAEELFRAMGMNMGTALNMFLTQSVRDWKLPFQPSATRTPSRRLEDALEESEEIIAGKKSTKRYGSFKEMWEDV